MDPVVTPEELLDRVGEVTLLDVRWQLGRSDGREQHQAGHLPGAAFVDLDRDLAGAPGAGGRHPLPGAEAFGAAMRRCGVRAARPVVVYDDVGGTSAARAWWLLRHHGHPDVRVLDGGLTWWVRVGGDVETGPVDPVPGDFRPSLGGWSVLDAEGAARTARDGVLLDARAPERFRGETEPVDPVAGHVPGAVNLPTARNLVADGDHAGRLRTSDALAEDYAVAVDAHRAGRPVGASCGSGITATHDLLVLARLGIPAALYAGSWSHWVTDPSRPVATGAAPTSARPW